MRRYTTGFLAAAIAAWPGLAAAQAVAVIAQSGDGHGAAIVQSGALDQSVSVQQIGTATAADIRQDAPVARAELSLTGQSLAASLRQEGQAAADFTLSMEGSNGLVDAVQQGDAGGSNIAHVWQSGSDNSAALSQFASAGAPNMLSLIQDGTANIATLSQTGEGNDLAVAQYGAANVAAIDQVGSGLVLGLTQNGGASVSITQTGP